MVASNDGSLAARVLLVDLSHRLQAITRLIYVDVKLSDASFDIAGARLTRQFSNCVSRLGDDLTHSEDPYGESVIWDFMDWGGGQRGRDDIESPSVGFTGGGGRAVVSDDVSVVDHILNSHLDGAANCTNLLHLYSFVLLPRYVGSPEYCQGGQNGLSPRGGGRPPAQWLAKDLKRVAVEWFSHCSRLSMVEAEA